MRNRSTDYLLGALLALALSSCGTTQLQSDLPAPTVNSGAQIKAPTSKEQPLKTPAPHTPTALQATPNLLPVQPKKIALLLPMQGRLAEAGAAVSDGFFAAYYQQIGKTHVPAVQRYDSSQDAAAAYQQAVKDGAELIIGPVDKDGVNKISQLPTLSVPLLSLTYPDQQPARALANFYQFGLAVEDEARQVARQAIADGHTQAFIVATAQEVSERSAQAFSAEWQKLGGVIIDKTHFSTLDKFSEHVRQLMQLDDNKARSEIDMIFMAVSPAQGRQIKPVLVFQYADNIPVYATSSIYSGDPDASNNEDLNGILFNTLPWLFDTASPIKQAIAQTSKSAAVYGRLHALGADAFMLHARLSQLAKDPNMKIYGATGALQLQRDGRIEREQMWARFNHGLAEPQASVIDMPAIDSPSINTPSANSPSQKAIH